MHLSSMNFFSEQKPISWMQANALAPKPRFVVRPEQVAAVQWSSSSRGINFLFTAICNEFQTDLFPNKFQNTPFWKKGSSMLNERVVWPLFSSNHTHKLGSWLKLPRSEQHKWRDKKGEISKRFQSIQVEEFENCLRKILKLNLRTHPSSLARSYHPRFGPAQKQTLKKP